MPLPDFISELSVDSAFDVALRNTGHITDGFMGTTSIGGLLNQIQPSTSITPITFTSFVRDIPPYSLEDPANGAFVFNTTKTLDGFDHIFALNNNGVAVFQVHASGTISLAYTEDRTPSGSGTPTPATGTWTPNTSSTATLVIAGISFTSTYSVSVTATIDAMVAAIVDSLVADVVTCANVGGTHMSISSQGGAPANNLTLATNGAHGSAVSGPTLTGGTGANTTINTPSGRIVMGAGQGTYTVISNITTSTSIIIPVVESIGADLALGVLPFTGSFILVNVATNPQITVSFQVANQSPLS